MNPQHINKYRETLCYLPLIALMILFAGKSIYAPVGDFGNYYYASDFLLKGKWGAWIYDTASFNLAVYKEGQRNFFLNYTPVPPLSAVLYIPFALTDVVYAKLLWNGVNILLFLIALYRLQQHFKIDPLLMLLIPVVLYTPIRNIIYEGQSYLLLFFLLSEGLMRYLQHQKWYAFFLWAIAIHLKVSPAFILLFLLCEKDWKSSLQLLLCGVLLLLVTVPFLGMKTWMDYGQHILPRLYSGEINNTYAVNYQSMQVLLKTIFVPDAMHNSHAWIDSPVWYQRISTAFNILIYGLAVLCSFTQIKSEVKFGVWLIASLLVSGYGNSFSLLLLLLPFICTWWHLREKGMHVALLVLLFLIANVPLSWFSGFPLPFQFPRLWLLLIVFFAWMWWVRPAFKSYYLALLFVVFLVPVQMELYEQNYVLHKEEDILIYNFKPDGNTLQLDVFNMSGPLQKQMNLPFTVSRFTTASPQRVATGREHVPVSYLVNDSVIIYLSDKNRGAGFYTLRYEYINNAWAKQE
jgi:hypothetical protein